jgi:methyl-accepting chemotaxis protein
MHAAPLPESDHDIETSRSLSRSIVFAIGAASVLALGALAWTGSTLIRGYIGDQADSRLVGAADQSSLVIGRVVAERERQVALLASLPSMVDAARAGDTRARELGLVGQPIETVERRFDTERTLDIDPRVRAFLADRSTSLDLAEVLLTDRNGYNVVTTARTSDFVQSDEEWWRRAFRAGSAPSSASFDESARRISVSVAAAVRDTDADPPVGVLKVVYGLAPIQEALTRSASGTGLVIDLIDEEGNVIVSSSDSAGLRTLPGFATIRAARGDALIDYDADGEERRAATRMANGGSWRIVAHASTSVAAGQLRTAMMWLGLIGGGMLIALIAVLTVVSTFMNRRISRPAAALAAATESVAAGDFSVRIAPSEADDEIGRLSRATSKMIAELRRLATAIIGSARETATMATDITAGAEHMASAAQQMADTSGDLSAQSSDMAETIQEMATDAARLVELSAALTTGAHDGVERNQRLRDLARENRARFDASARELDALVDEVQSSAASVEALAAASGEIKAFVTLVQKMARQSKLLALNAAMEAARAGDQGEGFAVVASEVRRLSASSFEAAERTEKLVLDVLQRIEQSRQSSARSAAAARSVRELTSHGLESFAQVEEAVVDTESWTTEIERAANTVSAVVSETTHRLDALARGTETFAAAMQEVAASSQEQSASTQEIAAAAAALAGAAERLSTLVAAVRLEEAVTPPAPTSTPDASDDGGQSAAVAAGAAPAVLSIGTDALAPA